MIRLDMDININININRYNRYNINREDRGMVMTKRNSGIDCLNRLTMEHRITE